MKKYIVLLLMIAPVISCQDFLDEKQVSSLTQDYYKSESGLDALIKGLYVYARVKQEWDGNGAKLIEPETDGYMHTSTAIAKITSDAYSTNTSTIAGNINNFIGAANTASYAPMGAYPHINNCNIALDIIDNIKPGKFGSDETYYKTRRAEVLFLRAWAYYLISNQLGDVPLLTTPKYEDNGIYFYPKTSIVDIYKRIIADVRYAYENLPVTVTDRGRVTKLAAGHFLAKLYLNRAQAAGFQGNSIAQLSMLFKGDVSTDLDSVILITTDVINSAPAPKLAADYWTLFNPAVSESSPSSEVLWAAQFDVNTSLGGRFGGNRSCNYHIGSYELVSGVVRNMAYGRPFSTYKPTDWGYDNFHDKVNDSRFHKTFNYEYIGNANTSLNWNATTAAYWNTNKPASEPTVTANTRKVAIGKRALVFIENKKSEALDSLEVMSQPYLLAARWIHSSASGKDYYRVYPNGTTIGLATNNNNNVQVYLSSKKFVDPTRGGSSADANITSEAGTRDAILMRLAETYLIRAEAYGRKGQYALAVDDINVLRKRASYKSGEARPEMAVRWEAGATSLPANEKVTPYTVTADTYPAITVTENHFTPSTAEAIAEGYIPTVTTKADMFIHFIYNEKAREFLSEGLAWEDLHNAGILYDRVIYSNQMASDLTANWPVAANTENGNGQDGNGKGLYQWRHTFRPWPNAYLILLTDEQGNALSDEAKAAYQNPGY